MVSDIEKVSKGFAEGMSAYKVRSPLIGWKWADKYFKMTKAATGQDGEWECYPLQRAVVNWMTSDDIEILSFPKPKRWGYTKCVVIAVFYYMEQKLRNTCIWHPSDGDAEGFVKKEINPVIDVMPLIGNLMDGVTEGKRGKNNTLTSKIFKNGVALDIKGGKSRASYRALSKDVAVYEELSAFDEDIGGAGSPLSLGDGRLEQSNFPKSIRGSTCHIKGVCMIEKSISDADMIFKRYLPCPHCGFPQALEFEYLRVTDKDPQTAHYICRENGCVFYWEDYKSMDDFGIWKTVEGVWYDEERDMFFDAEDTRVMAPRHIGVNSSFLYSRNRPWAFFMREWIKSTAKAKTGDTTELKAFVTECLAEQWEEKGESIPAHGFTDRLEPYTDDNIPCGVIVITFGADVQGGKHPRIELEILGHGLDGETWSIDYVVLPGSVEDPGVWEMLDEQLERKFTREDGVEMMIIGGLVDSGYQTTHVYNYASPRNRRGVYPSKGVNTGEICKSSQSTFKKSKKRVALMTVNVDDVKNIVFKRLKKNEDEPGYCHFPAHYEQSYFDGLTNEQKKAKKRAGRLIGYVWLKIKEHMPNEQLDCRVYATAALQRYIDKNQRFLQQRKLKQDQQAERIRLGLPETTKPAGRRIRSSRSRG